MRTRNEKLLVILLILIVVGGGNFYGYQWLDGKRQALTLQYAKLRADKAEAQLDLQNLDLWKKRKEWMRAHEPALTDEGDDKAQVLESVLKGARDQHLEILEQALGDVQHAAGTTCVNVSVKAKGPMQSLCQWLSGLQKPASFYAVSEFSLKADQDQKSMVCTLQLSRYFQDGGKK